MSIKNSEIELKLKVADPNEWNAIANYVKQLKNCISIEQLDLSAIYYDTVDKLLSKNRVAYRVRRENNQWISTIKGGGSVTNGIHKRIEYNMPVESGRPDLNVFPRLPVDEVTEAILRQSNLYAVLQTDFTRQAITVTFNESKIEIALDKGKIYADGKECPILEVEIELISGREESLLQLGDMLINRFSLEREEYSKFARGLMLSGNLKT